MNKEEIAFAIEQTRSARCGRSRIRLTDAAGVADGEVAAVRRTTPPPERFDGGGGA